MSNKSRSLGGIIAGVLGTVLVLFGTGWVLLNRQYILDVLNVWWYKPTAAVSSITDRSGLSNDGQFYFYASQPRVESASDFNNSCVRQEASSAILGCYSAQRIYIYDVTNKELDGVEEVTAAHETLHAIWERMGAEEKKRVGALLESAYQKIDDPNLNERMSYYDRTEPGERDNELHSILGTEYKDLGSGLEAHYQKYFADRSKIVELHQKYQSKFDELKKQSDTLAAEMAILKKAIDDQTTQYNSEAASISADAAALKQSYNTVDRTSKSEVDAYNARRQELLNRIDSLDALRAQIISETNDYNEKVTQYNALVVTTNELNSSLDSTLAPAPSI